MLTVDTQPGKSSKATKMLFPKLIKNWINGSEVESESGQRFDKLAPVDGRPICNVTQSTRIDVQKAISAALTANKSWREMTVVKRGDYLRTVAMLMQERKEEIAKIVSLETGKSFKDALGETGAAIEMGFFVAGEGRRFYGKTTTSGVPNKTAMTVRQPIGVAGLIIAANTPIANVAWKAFPALLCGDTVIMKPSEDTPISAWYFATLTKEAGIPDGVFNLINGFGEEAGAPLVESPLVDIISFTGSCEVGKIINRVAGGRLAKVCLELGGEESPCCV